MKIDKGFSFSYWNLSYRRKFIRTLWMTPFIVFISVLFCYNDIPIFTKVLIIAFLIIVDVIQLLYNYKQYQKEKAEKGTL